MTRNSKSVFSNIGASTHSDYRRNKNDFYVTDKSAITLLHKHGLLDENIKYWENACGNGVLVEELRNLGYYCVGSDSETFDGDDIIEWKYCGYEIIC